MSGYVVMHRGWQDHAIFSGDVYSRRDAWAWLIQQAAWKPTRVKASAGMVTLQRGQFTFSLRFLAQTWGWSKSAVDRFLTLLVAENMLEKWDSSGTATGTAAGQQPGHPQAILTICNYDKFQTPKKNLGTAAGQQPGQACDENRDKEKEGNKGTIEPKEEEGGGNAFFGRTIRLKPSDLDSWRKAFNAIGDLEAELCSLDAWFEMQPEAKRKNWFSVTAGSLNRRHQELTALKVAQDNAPVWDGMP